MDRIPQSWQESLMVGATYTVTQFSEYLPRIVGAILVLLVGLLVARVVRRIVIKSLETVRVSKVVEQTPLELFLKNAEVGQKIEDMIGSVVYWLLVLVIVHTAVSLLGLTTLSTFFDRILDYIPHIVIAALIFFFGVLLAGMVEGMVKGMMRSIDTVSARLFGKVASYVVVSITTLAAVAELGIASDFIRILFVGLTFALSLGAGLAIGLGGQETVRSVLERWSKKVK